MATALMINHTQGRTVTPRASSPTSYIPRALWLCSWLYPVIYPPWNSSQNPGSPALPDGGTGLQVSMLELSHREANQDFETK